MTKRVFQIYRYDPDTDAKPRMQTLEVELKKVKGRDEIPLFIYHLKPAFYDVTKNELAALRLKNVHLVELTDEFAF